MADQQTVSLPEKQRKDLVATALEAKEKAYAKYSDFPVGAALLCQDGTVITGCNVCIQRGSKSFGTFHSPCIEEYPV